MAVYRVDQYARTFYGPNPDPRPGFDERTFTAYSQGYDTIFLTWDPPTGDYTGFRLLSSRYGYPADAEDGTILVDSGAAPGSYVDMGPVPGRFIYYAIFLRVDNVWVRTGTASTLHVADTGAVDWFWFLIPHHYRLLLGNYLTIDADSNQDLRKLIDVLGFGVDRLRTSLEAARYSSDLRITHIGTAAAIAASIGAFAPEGISPARLRAITLDSTYLAANRGHPNAIRAAARAASGWDVLLRPSHNLVPSPDQAELIHPIAPEWDASIHYTVGALVTTDDWLYRCIAAAYGIDQAAPGNGSSNTWWAVHSVIDDRTVAYDETLLTQHGWVARSLTTALTADKVATRIVRGVPDPVREGIMDANALTIHNTSTSTTGDIAAWSLPNNPTDDPLVPIQYGVPIPRVFAYNRARAYHAGDLVSWRGLNWRAAAPSLGSMPATGNPAWVALGTDERMRLTVSGYAHAPHTNTAKPAAAVYPYVTWYDEYGKVIGTADTRTTADTTRVLDSFNTFPGTNALLPLAGRTTDSGGRVWVDPVPGMIRDSYLGGSVRPADPAARALSVIDYAAANATVAATYASAVPGKQQCLILRYSDPLNYVRATRVALQAVVAGAVTTLVTYASPVLDGDRLTVKVTGNNYTVLRNSTQVATATSSVNSTSTRFGLAVEV